MRQKKSLKISIHTQVLLEIFSYIILRTGMTKSDILFRNVILEF